MPESMDQFQDHLFHNHHGPTPHLSTQDLLHVLEEEEEPKPSLPEKSYHLENLAEYLDDRITNGIASDLLQAIEEDMQSRSEWESILEEAIDQLGITIEKTNLPFSSATGVFSSSFMRTVLMAVANMSGELLPPNGPVKATILGQHTDELEDQQTRVESFMNFYLTNIAQEFYPEMEQAFMWDALYGSVFLKTYFDVPLGRPVIKYIPPQDFVVNYNASSLSTCTRMTQVIMLDKKELKVQQLMGYYKKLKVHPVDQLSTDSISSITEKISGKAGIDQNMGRSTNQYLLYECHANLDLSSYERTGNQNEDNLPLPYIVTIDKKSRQILRLVRNWEEGDLLFKRKEFFTKLSFWPGLGMYSFGLAHIAGGSAKAATAIQRLLIDAGILANFPGGIIDAAVQMEQNNVKVGPTEFAKVRLGGQKIDEVVSFIPYRDPSPVLKELKNDLEQNVTDLAAATDFKVDNLNSNVSATTTYLQLEQVNKLQNTVIQRLHRAMGEAYRLLYKLFGETLGDNSYPFKVVGSAHTIMKRDFNDSLHISPNSDATITSSLQRIIRGQVISEYAEKNPDIHDKRAIQVDIYKDMKIPQAVIDRYLPKPQETPPPPPMDPITENQAQMTGKPVKAYPFQDQDAYIATKQLLLQKPDLDPNVQSAIQANIMEREAFKYKQQLQQTMGEELPDDLSQLTPDQQNHIAQQAAIATQKLMQEMQQSSPPPLTPEMVMMKDVEVKEKANENKFEMDKLKLQVEEQKLEITKYKIDVEKQIAELRAQTESYKANLQHMDA